MNLVEDSTAARIIPNCRSLKLDYKSRRKELGTSAGINPDRLSCNLLASSLV